MIASEQEEVLWVFDLVAHEEENRLKRVFASINIVAKEEEVRRWGEAAHFEHSNEIRVLAMNVANDLDRRVQLQKWWLLEEYFPYAGAYRIDFCVSQNNSFGTLASISSIQESLDVIVYIGILQLAHCHGRIICIIAFVCRS